LSAFAYSFRVFIEARLRTRDNGGQRSIMKACKEKVKPQIGLAARKFGRRWGERSAAQISHHKVPA
jgi:hypothetical protein